MKGVVETLTKFGHCIDIVCDGEPEENFLAEHGINVYTPDKVDRLSYSKHSTLFQFVDSFNFEKSINFRTAIVKALSNHTYDLIICNDTESAFVCYQMELYKHIKITSYAHECTSINPSLGAGVFKDCYYDLIDKMMFWPEMTTLIQTDQNKTKLLDKFDKYPLDLNAIVQLYPITDSDSLNLINQEGLLFIGRHEDRKNPEAYVKVLAGIKEKYGVELKAKVLTRKAHVKKFEADFAAIGHVNYEIKADVVGEEKAKMIQSSKVAFMPYKNESFGIAVMESLRFMPTVVLDKYNWHYNFHHMTNLTIATQADCADVIWNLYNNHVHNEEVVAKEFKEYQDKYESSLLNLLNRAPFTNTKQEPRNRLYTYLKENRGTWVSVSEYFKTQNTKGTIYLTSDIESMYTNANWYKSTHTNSNTYLGIPDEIGNLSHKETFVESKDNEAFSSFFG
jgi:hypothetical protein